MSRLEEKYFIPWVLHQLKNVSKYDKKRTVMCGTSRVNKRYLWRYSVRMSAAEEYLRWLLQERREGARFLFLDVAEWMMKRVNRTGRLLTKRDLAWCRHDLNVGRRAHLFGNFYDDVCRGHEHAFLGYV